MPNPDGSYTPDELAVLQMSQPQMSDIYASHGIPVTSQFAPFADSTPSVQPQPDMPFDQGAYQMPNGAVMSMPQSTTPAPAQRPDYGAGYSEPGSPANLADPNLVRVDQPMRRAEQSAAQAVPRPAPVRVGVVGAGQGGLTGAIGRMAKESQVASNEYQRQADAYGAQFEASTQEQSAAMRRAGQTSFDSAAQAQAVTQDAMRSAEQTVRERAVAKERADKIQASTLQEIDAAQREQDAMQAPHDRRSQSTIAMGAIAVAMSGLGDAISAAGGARTNFLQTTLGIIDTAIERDLQEQRDAYTMARNKTAGAQQKLDRYQQIARNDNEWLSLKAADAERQYAAQLRGIAAQSEGTRQGEIATATAAELEARAAQRKADFAQGRALEEQQRSDQLALKKLQMQQAAGASAANRQIKVAKDLADIRKTNAEAAQLETEARGGAKANPTIAAKAADIDSVRASISEDMKRLEEIRARNRGRLIGDSADSREARNIISSIADKQSTIAGGGQAGEAAKREILDTIPDPTDTALWTDPSKVYRQIEAHTNRVANARIRALGGNATTEAQDQAAQLVRPGLPGASNR